MYKERLKAGINPIWTIPIWAVSIYLLTVIWGIAQILIGFKLPYAMQILLFAITFLFGWYLISKYLTEYEITVSSRYITVTRFLSKKTAPVRTIRKQSISLITDNKKDLRKYKINKSENFIRAFQKGNPIYVIYTENEICKLAKIKLSGLNAKEISDKFAKEGI